MAWTRDTVGARTVSFSGDVAVVRRSGRRVDLGWARNIKFLVCSADTFSGSCRNGSPTPGGRHPGRPRDDGISLVSERHRSRPDGNTASPTRAGRAPSSEHPWRHHPGCKNQSRNLRLNCHLGPARTSASATTNDPGLRRPDRGISHPAPALSRGQKAPYAPRGRTRISPAHVASWNLS